MQHERCVFRSIAFPVATFDLLKQFQRDYEGDHGVSINNNQALTIILTQHRQHIEESGLHGKRQLDTYETQA